MFGRTLTLVCVFWMVGVTYFNLPWWAVLPSLPWLVAGLILIRYGR